MHNFNNKIYNNNNMINNNNIQMHNLTLVDFKRMIDTFLKLLKSYLLQCPLWTNVISSPVLQASTSNEQLLSYVLPFDPHTGAYIRGQISGHFASFIWNTIKKKLMFHNDGHYKIPHSSY